MLWCFTWLLSFGLLSYFLHYFIVTFWCKPKNLKEAYGAEWGLVTGASSGIGKSLAKKLASQGVNVVLIALDDTVFAKTFEEIKSAYPDVLFRKVGTDLGKHGYLDAIIEATDDIKVQAVFLNAGYILTGFFDNRALEQHLANLEVNATSAVSITHHFLKKLVEAKLRGCFVFTSSAAAVLPNPLSVLYAATKSFVSSFGASLATEVKPFGIDVLVFHPSPVATRFYDGTKTRMDALEFFKKFAVDPDALPDLVFGGLGRAVWLDVGLTALAFRSVMKLVDYNLLAMTMAAFGGYMPDFKRYLKARSEKAQ